MQVAGWDLTGLMFESFKSNLQTRIPQLSDRSVLLVARCLAKLRPLGVYPGWYFSVAETSQRALVKLRQAIWNTCHERRLQKPIVFRWYDRSKINLYLGNDVSRPTYIGGCIEPNEFAFIGSVLKPGMVMIDIGANDGLFTVFAAKRVGKKGRVFAFEPSTREFARLKANIALNRLRNVTAVPKALSNISGSTQLKISEYGHEGQNTLGDFAHAVKQAGIQMVEVCRLDEWLRGQDICRLDLIKIDVEGAEHKVLQGGQETIRKFKPIILVELLDKALQYQGSSAGQVIQFLLDLNYRIYDFSLGSGKPVPSDFRTHSDNIVASPRPLDTG